MVAARSLELASADLRQHAAIGNGRACALVDGRGAIVWLCWPRFDSEPIFAALLDPLRGGSFRVAPATPAPSCARYVDDTNVVATHFELDGGALEVIDLMPIEEDGARRHSLAAEHEILRFVSTDVDVLVRVELDPRPRFGRKSPRLRVGNGGTVRFQDGVATSFVRASRPLVWRSRAAGGLTADVAMKAGETVVISLLYTRDGPAVFSTLPDGAQAARAETLACWRRWAGRCRWDGPHRSAIVRSALALKLLCYVPSGAIIAAPTTSLPERLGGSLNWDYRFCWLRDAAFTARALFGLGYDEEANAFVDWLVHATRLTRPALRVLYDVFGERPTREREIEALDGYRGARPVRVGNAARDQVQLDVYGEVIDAIAQSCHSGRRADSATVEMLRDFAEYVVEHWAEADQGIWEPRSGGRHHVHSRVLCWVALDRALRLEDDGFVGWPARVRDRFGEARAAIAREVREKGFSRSQNSYVAELGGSTVDASLLLLSWYGFEPACSPRMRGTFDAIERSLGIGGGLLRRNADLGDGGGFAACAFWAVDHLARGGGALEEARARFERLLVMASPTGLWGEIVDADGRAHLGNYPQGFSHLALINAALSIAERGADLRERREVRT